MEWSHILLQGVSVTDTLEIFNLYKTLLFYAP